MKLSYKTALRIAAEQAYQNEIVDTQMEQSLIGEDKEYADKEDWIGSRMMEWIAESRLMK